MSNEPYNDQDAQPSDDATQPAQENRQFDNGSLSPADRLKQATDATRGPIDDKDDDHEAELWQGSFSSRAMIGKWVLAGSVTVLLLVVILATGIGSSLTWWGWIIISAGLWIYFAAQLAYRKMSVNYLLTSQRFIHKSGILKRVTDRIEMIDIDDVSFEQRLVERILGVGSIVITSSDRSHPKLTLYGIEGVERVAGLIDDTRRKERRKRGLHIEAI